VRRRCRARRVARSLACRSAVTGASYRESVVRVERQTHPREKDRYYHDRIAEGVARRRGKRRAAGGNLLKL
jgi:hypothetical protein